ncbi:hypothetical protein NDN08_007965 [Rhodosorus marinus]|uniref:Protein kinase domain-containing protein n=1 Tax=Rhodosorus marinus TaxID=101924 RepID=A0AAV8V1V3_9RHOD|nr:hypothetical protein NDN08_007965 [Rhodosorus marinus]
MADCVNLLDLVVGEVDADEKTRILPQNIDIASVKKLRSTREASNKEDVPMIESTFVTICGDFLRENTSAKPETVFRFMDVFDEDEVTMRFFVFAYLILCKNTPEYRAHLLLSSAKLPQSDIMDVTSLGRMILFLNLCACRIDQNIERVDPETAMLMTEKVVHQDVQNGVEPLTSIKQPVSEWLNLLNRFAEKDENDLDRRVFVERDLIALEMERLETTLKRDESQSVIVQESSPEGELDLDSLGILSTPRKSFTERPRGPVIQLRKTLSVSRMELDLPFSIDIKSLKWNKVIGSGAFATVWNAEWLHMPVAVKVLHGEMHNLGAMDAVAGSEERTSDVAEYGPDENSRRDFLREIEVLTQLRHPNVLLCMGACVSVGKPLCIVTELYNGGSLHELLHGPNKKELEVEQFLDLGVEVARGMLYLHSSTPTILHRDLKASNILVDKHLSHCVICDFGLSRLVELGNINPSVHGAPDARGTPYTMAPEVMDGAPYTTAADVYSFGVILWELWTAEIPFDGLQPIQLMFKVYAEGERPPITPEHNMHEAIESLIVRCWDEMPSARPTFEQILDELESESLRKDLVGLSKRKSLLTPADKSHLLMAAIQSGAHERVEELLKDGVEVNFMDYDKRTPLHLAAAERNADIVRCLVEAGADVNSRDRWGSTPLQDAYLSNSEAIVKILLEAGATAGNLSMHADVNSGQKAVEDLESLSMDLMRAIFRRDIDKVRNLLREGADPSFADYDNRTPLHLAASEGAAEIGALICLHGNVDLDARDRWGSTPLMDAQRSGHTEMQLVIEVAKAKRDLRKREQASERGLK